MLHRRSIQLCILLACATQLHAQPVFVTNSDVRPRAPSGKIITDGFSDSTGQLVQGVRTFGWDFRQIPGDPYFIQDPGFNAVNGSGLPGSSSLGFNIVRNLGFWDGGGPLGFLPAIADSLRLNFGASNRLISGTTGDMAGFNFVTINSSGAAHRHLNAFLNGADGNSIAGDGVEAATGVYFTAIRLTSTGALTPSDPIWMLFNNGTTTATFERALDYVADPIPGDANFSGRVDLADFSLLAANFGASSERFWYDADFTGDYAVTLADFSLLAANFNSVAPSGARPVSNPIPEPGMAAVGFASAWALRRRRVS